MRLHIHSCFITLFLICCFGLIKAQYTIPRKPQILYPVYDEVGLLSLEEKKLLNQKLISFEDSTSVEIEVVIIPSTRGEDINFLATRFGQEWGIGKKGVDNGVVFLIAARDKKMAIQQGRRVEQYLTASVSGQILDYLVTPQFRQNNWFGGVNAGIDGIMQSIQGKFKPAEKKEEREKWYIYLIIILFIIIFIINNNKNNNRRRHDDVILTRRGRSIYSRGFFPPIRGGLGGGGFGGFGGGGSFGGGGASGGW